MAPLETSWSDLSADERGELRIANWPGFHPGPRVVYA
jgi:hypothetical protein